MGRGSNSDVLKIGNFPGVEEWPRKYLKNWKEKGKSAGPAKSSRCSPRGACIWGQGIAELGAPFGVSKLKTERNGKDDHSGLMILQDSDSTQNEILKDSRRRSEAHWKYQQSDRLLTLVLHELVKRKAKWKENERDLEVTNNKKEMLIDTGDCE